MLGDGSGGGIFTWDVQEGLRDYAETVAAQVISHKYKRIMIKAARSGCR
jgi:hypothetical protein